MTLTTSAVATGTVAMATVLAEQAKAAGVTININNVPPGTFFGQQLPQVDVLAGLLQLLPRTCRRWPSRCSRARRSTRRTPTTRSTPSLYNQANATANPSLRKEILLEMQQFDFNQGGYIIPAYIDVLDAYSDKITGYTAGKVGQPLSELRLRALRVRRVARAMGPPACRRGPSAPREFRAVGVGLPPGGGALPRANRARPHKEPGPGGGSPSGPGVCRAWR